MNTYIIGQTGGYEQSFNQPFISGTTSGARILFDLTYSPSPRQLYLWPVRRNFIHPVYK